MAHPTKAKDLALDRFPAQRALIDMPYAMGVGRPGRTAHGVHHGARGSYNFEALRLKGRRG